MCTKAGPPHRGPLIATPESSCTILHQRALLQSAWLPTNSILSAVPSVAPKGQTVTVLIAFLVSLGSHEFSHPNDSGVEADHFSIGFSKAYWSASIMLIFWRVRMRSLGRNASVKEIVGMSLNDNGIWRV